MSSITKYQRSDGGRKGWRIQVSLGTDRDGKRRTRSRTFYPTCSNPWGRDGRREAEQAELEFRAEIGKASVSELAELPLSFVFAKYVEANTTRAGKPWSPKTLENTLKSVDLIVGHMGDPPVGEIRPSDVGELMAWMRTPAARKRRKLGPDGEPVGLTATSAQRHFDVLRAMFSYAIEEDIVDASPLKKRHRPKREEPYWHVPTDEDVRRLIAWLVDTPFWYTFAHVAATTGARRGELVGLQWGDIEPEQSRIHIRRNHVYANRQVHEQLPKNGRTRTTDIGPAVAFTLHQYRTSIEELTGPVQSDWYVFSPDYSGPAVHPDAVKRWWARLRQQHDYLAPCRFHSLRHYVGTVLVASGMGYADVAQQLGHTNAMVTAQRYSHARPQNESEAARRMGLAIGDLPGLGG